MDAAEAAISAKTALAIVCCLSLMNFLFVESPKGNHTIHMEDRWAIKFAVNVTDAGA